MMYLYFCGYTHKGQINILFVDLQLPPKNLHAPPFLFTQDNSNNTNY